MITTPVSCLYYTAMGSLYFLCVFIRKFSLTIPFFIMENANPSSFTPSSEFLDPNKKLEIESWIEDSKRVDLVVSLDDEIEDEIEEEEEEDEEEEEEEEDDLEYFNTFRTMEELGYHKWLLKNPRPPWVRA
ncbi:hypothetical protein Tco_0140758 [Tanacetum coccineum]